MSIQQNSLLQADPFHQRPWIVAAFVLVMSYGWTSVILLPIQINAYVVSYGMTEAKAGLLTGLEIGALSLTALAVSRAIHRMNKRTMCLAGAALVLCCNLFSLLDPSGLSFLICRVLSGVGFGLVVAATNALPAGSSQSATLFSWGQLGVGLFGCSLIFVLPALATLSPSASVYGIEIFASVLAFVAALKLPRGISEAAEPNAAQGSLVLTLPAMGALIGTLLFFLAQTAIWAFAFRSGTSLGLAGPQAENYLAWSLVIGISGAIGALVLNARIGFVAPLTAGLMGVAAFGLIMYNTGSQPLFVAGLLIVNIFIIFASPYILDVLARLDEHGRLASAGGAFVNIGCALAPIVAGHGIKVLGYGVIGYGSAAMLLLALLAILPAARAVQ